MTENIKKKPKNRHNNKPKMLCRKPVCRSLYSEQCTHRQTIIFPRFFFVAFVKHWKWKSIDESKMTMKTEMLWVITVDGWMGQTKNKQNNQFLPIPKFSADFCESRFFLKVSFSYSVFLCVCSRFHTWLWFVRMKAVINTDAHMDPHRPLTFEFRTNTKAWASNIWTVETTTRILCNRT